jgi:O-antigen ligase
VTQGGIDGLDRHRRALRLALIALLFLSALPFGSVEPWSVLAVELACAALGAGAFWIITRDPGGLPPQARWLLLPLGVLIVIAVLQVIPMPAGFARLLSPAAVEAREAVGSLVTEVRTPLAPVSLSAPDSFDALLRLVAYVLAGLATAVAIRSKHELRRVAFAIALCGAFQALYGSAEYLSGRQHIFFYAKKHFLDEATGTFINRNHFAGYLAMTLPVAFGLLFSRTGEHKEPGSWRARLLRFTEASNFRLILAGFAAFLIWNGVILSYSRSGLVCALFASALLALTGARRGRGVRLLAGCLLLATLFAAVLHVRAPGERFVTLGADLSPALGRLAVWRATLGLVADHPIVGSGFGTFEATFPLYQRGDLGAHYNHAHNDWLQVLAEGGFLSLMAVSVLLGLILVHAWRGLRARPGGDLLGASLVAGIAAISLHSLFDFCLRIPAIGLLLAIMIGMHASMALQPSRRPAGLVELR